MNHIVYLDYKANELQSLIEARKNMIVRGATGRKMPYGRVFENDVLYFIENNGDGLVKARANVKHVFNSEKLENEESKNLIAENKEALQLNPVLTKKYAGKRYLVLIEVVDFELIDPFEFNHSLFANMMDDWLPFERVESIMK